jgi:hypothetical protein
MYVRSVELAIHSRSSSYYSQYQLYSLFLKSQFYIALALQPGVERGLLDCPDAFNTLRCLKRNITSCSIFVFICSKKAALISLCPSCGFLPVLLALNKSNVPPPFPLPSRKKVFTRTLHNDTRYNKELRTYVDSADSKVAHNLLFPSFDTLTSPRYASLLLTHCLSLNYSLIFLITF